jgi:hypothetical protein
MGMYDNMKDIIKVLKNDEILLRLLYYPVKNYNTNTPDPLDESLENVLDMDASVLKEIREKRIMLIPKADDLTPEPLCRIYVYAGRRKPDKSYHYADQEIVVEVFCHNNFETDLRSMRINDRINELLINGRIVSGFGKIEYVRGHPIEAPMNYVAYQNVYEVGNFK